MNTIAAISTALGNSAINIIRLSGEQSLQIASQMFSASELDFSNIMPRYMYLGNLHCSGFSDKCLMVYFKAPNSYTGEDLVEFHCHGGAKIASEVLKTLLQNGATLASRGEFTKRAFISGKLSLSEAEGVVDMINAESLSALNCGYRLMSGKLNEKLHELEDILLDTVAQLEAAFDYPEELEDEATENACDKLDVLIEKLTALSQSSLVGRYIKNGINVAIIGEPNCGKSSLLNALTGSDRAIVTDIAGTTRDTVEGRVEWRGVLLNFVDTAGIRHSDDLIENIGIQKAHTSAENADIVIILLDGSRTMTSGEIDLIATFRDKTHLVVVNKSDKLSYNTENLTISAKCNVGIEALLTRITDTFVTNSLASGQEVITNLRHAEMINSALDSVKKAKNCLGDLGAECLIIDLNAAYTALGEITGDTCSEDVIDRVFEKFCLGK